LFISLNILPPRPRNRPPPVLLPLISPFRFSLSSSRPFLYLSNSSSNYLYKWIFLSSKPFDSLQFYNIYFFYHFIWFIIIFYFIFKIFLISTKKKFKNKFYTSFLHKGLLLLLNGLWGLLLNPLLNRLPYCLSRLSPPYLKRKFLISIKKYYFFFLIFIFLIKIFNNSK